MSPRTIDARPVSPPRRSRARSRLSIGSERSMPTNRGATRATGSDRRPVPHPSSSTVPFARKARSDQNRTSRRPMVRRFSQS